MPRRGARKHVIRRRFKRIRQENLAYYVPRQGVRRKRTPTQARAEWEGAQAAMRYRAAQRRARARPPVHARPLKKKRPWWSWLILDWEGFQNDRRRR